MQNKSYNVKIYEPNGTYVTTVNESLRLSDIRFRSTMDAGQGVLGLKIKSDFDSPPAWAALNYFVKVFCVKLNGSNQTEQLLFTGLITRVEHEMQGSEEFMQLSVLGLSSLLGLALYKDGSNFNVVKSAVDPAVMAADVISVANTAIGFTWLSTGGNVETVGTAVSYTFKKLRWLEALQKIKSFAGGNFFWFIGADGELHFKQIPATASHKFNILKNVNSIKVVNSAEEIINESTVEYTGGSTKVSTDAASVTAYFKRDEYQPADTDLDANAAQQVADTQVTDNKEPKLQVSVEINSTFNIEGIKPGDTCKFFGTRTGSTVLGDNMVINSVEYNETTVKLTLVEDFGNFGTQLSKYLGNQLLDRQI